MKKREIISIILVVVVIVVIIAAYYFMPQSIEKIKNEDYVGKRVTVLGTVENTVKIGDLSGYTLRDRNRDTIPVSSESLPKEGSTRLTTGTLRKGFLIGYYIEES